VFEAELLLETTDDKGRPVRFGSIGGGGRYDDLVARFTGQSLPATGFSFGVSRLASALRAAGREDAGVRGPVVVIVMILVVPLFDTSFVLVLRRLAGRSATRGGTDHVSHRLVSLGFSERSADRILYLLGLIGGLTAWTLREWYSAVDPMFIVALFGVTVIIVGICNACHPFYTGTQKFVDTAGRVDKFQQRLAKTQAAQAAQAANVAAKKKRK
jgi:ribosomal protein L31